MPSLRGDEADDITALPCPGAVSCRPIPIELRSQAPRELFVAQQLIALLDPFCGRVLRTRASTGRRSRIAPGQLPIGASSPPSHLIAAQSMLSAVFCNIDPRDHVGREQCDMKLLTPLAGRGRPTL